MGRLFGYLLFSVIRSTDSGEDILNIIGIITLAFLLICLIYIYLIMPAYEKLNAWAESKRGSRGSDDGDGDTLSSKLMRWMILSCCLLLLIVCISV